MSHSSIGRREFVASSATLAGATFLGLAAACDAPDVVAPPSPAEPLAQKAGGEAGDLAEPRVIAGIGGIFCASLAIETQPVTIAGRRLHQPVTYGGTFPGPTLWVRPGQIIDLTFTNRIVFDQAGTRPGHGRRPRAANATNVHFHGMHVAPIGTADDMTVVLPALGAHRYLFEVPSDHPGGLFWYHAHVHELTTNHVGRGAAGMIHVANAHTDPRPRGHGDDDELRDRAAAGRLTGPRAGS